MAETRLAAIDLNLLVALDALLVERNVTRAAARIGITQPAMSHALMRLRRLLGDPLFVRTPREMVPTARAEKLAIPLRRALSDIQEALRSDAAFDPSKAERTFTMSMGDFASLVILPDFAARLREVAPKVDLRVIAEEMPWSRALDDGTADLAIAVSVHGAPSNIRTRKLFSERFVCVMRRDHPAARRPLTLDRFVNLTHALIAPGGRAWGIVDDALAERGLRRRIGLTIPHFLVAPFVIASSDFVITLPERVARRFAAAVPLRIVPTPIAIPGFSMHLAWHERLQREPAYVWLRRTLVEVEV